MKAFLILIVTFFLFPRELSVNQGEDALTDVSLEEHPGMRQGASAINVRDQTDPETAPYVTFDFEHPSSVLKLPGRLREISGLAISDGNRLIAVEDENGEWYEISTSTGEIKDRGRFASDGDYEGVEVIGDTLYALRSSGHLYIQAFRSAERSQTKRIQLELPRSCDAEALAYDGGQNHLLVACKSGDRVSGVRGRAVYAFDISGQPITDKPVLLIDNTLLAGACNKCGVRVEDFQPSGLAVHPVTGELFILSASRELLLIFSHEHSTIIHFELKRMKQPEGIAFDSNGTLYIASEGKGGKATLFSFDPTHRSTTQ